MKKTISLFLSVVFLAALAACARSGTAVPAETDAPAPEPASFPSLYVTTDYGGPVVVREYYGATFTLTGSDGGKYDFSDLPGQIKCRGNSTYHLPKKPYRIKFDEKINMLGQGGGPSKSWVLLANYNDRTMMRNRVTFAMGRKLDGIGFTSSSSFVRVFMNGVDLGVYELAEHHGDGKYRIDMKEDPEETDTDYLIEMDEYVKIRRDVQIPYTFDVGDRSFVVKSDAMTLKKWRFLSGCFKDVDAAVEEGSRERVEELVDVPSFVDTYLLQEISKNPDGGISSFFFLKKGGGKLFCTCPWDFDIAYGNDPAIDNGSFEGLFIGNPYHEAEDESGGFKPNRWFSLLMKRRWFVDLVAERWEEKKEELRNAALSDVEEALASYEDEMNSNYEIWRNDPVSVTGPDGEETVLKGWRENTEYLKEWIERRFDWLDRYWNDPENKYSYVES
ncbi:MAG: CotH kinase family protein [Clostridia bacterium]|nr:CotH kinase family protein [Clostridia bacterium]